MKRLKSRATEPSVTPRGWTLTLLFHFKYLIRLRRLNHEIPDKPARHSRAVPGISIPARLHYYFASNRAGTAA